MSLLKFLVFDSDDFEGRTFPLSRALETKHLTHSTPSTERIGKNDEEGAPWYGTFPRSLSPCMGSAEMRQKSPSGVSALVTEGAVVAPSLVLAPGILRYDIGNLARCAAVSPSIFQFPEYPCSVAHHPLPATTVGGLAST